MTGRAPTIAIAGIGCRFPGCPDAKTLASRLRRGAQSAGPLPRAPGQSAGDAVLMAMAASAQEALAPAFPTGLPRLALFVLGKGFEAASLAAAAGITPVLSRSTLSVADALAAARSVVLDGEADGALLVAGHALPAMESASSTAPAFCLPVEKTAAAPPPAEGAAALVLTRPDGRGPTRARLAALAVAGEPGARGVEHALHDALAEAGWLPAAVGLLGLIGVRSTAVLEATAIARAFKAEPRTTALTALRATVGDCGVAASLGALIAAVTALEGAMLPALPNWSAPGPAMLREAAGLFIADESRFWFTRPETPERRSLVLIDGEDNAIGVAALQAGPVLAPTAVTAATEGAPLLFPLAGADRGALEAGLAALTNRLHAGEPLASLSRDALKEAVAAAQAPLGLAIVAATPQELTRELGFMHRALEKAAVSGKAVRTPNGSVFTPIPLGRTGKLAFVYPGNGSAYPGLGREVLLSFAKGVAAAETYLGRRLPDFLRTDLTFPRSLERLGETERTALAAQLSTDPASLPLVGIAFGVAHTYILRACLGLKPDIAIGYSVGELAMRIALGQVKDWAGLEQKLHAPVLVSGLAGEMTTPRSYWRQTGAAEFADAGAVWACHMVKAPVDEVRAAVAATRNVFVMAINTADEVAVSGAPDACAKMLARLGAPSMPLEVNVAIHAPPAELEQRALLHVCDSPVEPVDGTAFYSAAHAAPVPQTREAVAAATARMLAHTLDFRRLIETVHDDGARIFIETGVRNNCTNWIAATLGERPHVAVSMDVKGMPSDVAWMRAVAQLFAHRVKLDFGELRETEIAAGATRLMALMEQG